jgi:hypothetical protein
MSAIPPWPKGKPFADAPTFDVLRERSGYKVAKLREALRDVPRFKCSDNTVRYDAAAATAALEGADPLHDELDDAAAAAASVAEPLPTDPVQAALAVMNRTLSLFSVVVRERGEVVRLCNDVIKTMGEPLKLGQDLVREGVAVMQTRLDKFETMWDRMVLLVEDLQSTQSERAAAQLQQADRAEMRKDAFGIAKKYLPDAIEKFSLTVEAAAAVDVLRSIDPEILESMLELDVVPKDLLPKARKLIDVLKSRRKSQAAPPPPPEAAPTEAAPSSAPSNGSPP